VTGDARRDLNAILASAGEGQVVAAIHAIAQLDDPEGITAARIADQMECPDDISCYLRRLRERGVVERLGEKRFLYRFTHPLLAPYVRECARSSHAR